MSLIQYMHAVPLWVTAAIVTALAAIYSVGLMLVARNRYGLDWLRLNNEVAGFKYAVVGVFYAVLLAFVVIAVWEEYRNTETAVRDEAKAAVNLHRVAHGLPDGSGREIHKTLAAYIAAVREHEWASMAIGEASDAAAKTLDRLTYAVFSVQPESPKEVMLYQDALRLLAVISNSRSERLESANGSVPPMLWFVLIIGGLITLGYPAFFGSTNLAAQILMTASLAALVALSLLLGLAFDYPFTGGVHISDFPFEEALQQMPEAWPPP
jgi:hypothetical protein